MPKGARGEKNGFWRGGRKVSKQGYIQVWIPRDHPLQCMAFENRYVLEHRLIMAEHLGHPLMENEVVHHKNGVVDDNRIENLQVMTNLEHARLHGEMRRQTHCQRGHPYDEANTYWLPDGTSRFCKACMKEHEQARTAKRSAERAARRAARGWDPWPYPHGPGNKAST